MTDIADPMAGLSLREKAEATTPQKRLQRAPYKGMSPKMRAFLMSPEHRARLIANLARYREQNGGKVASQKGTPNGWGGKARRRLRAELIAKAEGQAKQIMDTLIERGVVQKDAAGNAVLGWAVGVVLAKDADGKPCHAMKDMLQAAKMVLEFTMQKPVTKAEVTHSAESYLHGLLHEQPTIIDHEPVDDEE